LLVQSFFAISFLVGASLRLRPRGDEGWEESRRFSWFWNPKDPRFLTGYRHLRWRDRMERNPYFWLNTSVRLPLFGLKWMVLLAGIAWIVVGIGAVNGPDMGTRQRFFALGILVTFALHVVIKIFAGLLGTRSINEDRVSGSLEL